VALTHDSGPIPVIGGLIGARGELRDLRAEVTALRAENGLLRDKVSSLWDELTATRAAFWADDLTRRRLGGRHTAKKRPPV
jgi:hypothetical protein